MSDLFACRSEQASLKYALYPRRFAYLEEKVAQLLPQGDAECVIALMRDARDDPMNCPDCGGNDTTGGHERWCQRS